MRKEFKNVFKEIDFSTNKGVHLKTHNGNGVLMKKKSDCAI